MKINKQIAESLASKVAAQIQSANAERFSKIETELKNSKEFKKLDTLSDKFRELELQISQVRNDLEEARTKFYDVANKKRDNNTNISCNYSHSQKKMSVSVSSPVNIYEITQDIMIESAFADSKTSADEFIKIIVKKYI